MQKLDRVDPIVVEDEQNRPHKQRRWPFPPNDLTVEVEHPGGSESHHGCRCRYLCSTRAALIVRGFLHDATLTTLSLPTTWEGEENVKGKVTSCRHIHAGYHEVMMDFDETVDLRHFLDVPREHFDEFDSFDASDLAGRVLILIDQQAEIHFVKHYLNRTKVNYDSCTTIAEAAEQVRETSFDAVLFDSDIGDGSSELVVQSLGQAGFDGTFVVLSGNMSEDAIRTVNEIGMCEILAKPVNGSKLLNLLAMILQGVVAEHGFEPIYSNLSDDLETADLIVWYLDYLKKVLLELRGAIKADDMALVRQHCHAIMETAAGYGFPTVSTMAKAAITALDASLSITESLSELKRLERICKRLKFKDE